DAIIDMGAGRNFCSTFTGQQNVILGDQLIEERLVAGETGVSERTVPSADLRIDYECSLRIRLPLERADEEIRCDALADFRRRRARGPVGKFHRLSGVE